MTELNVSPAQRQHMKHTRFMPASAKGYLAKWLQIEHTNIPRQKLTAHDDAVCNNTLRSTVTTAPQSLHEELGL